MTCEQQISDFAWEGNPNSAVLQTKTIDKPVDLDALALIRAEGEGMTIKETVCEMQPGIEQKISVPAVA